MKLEELIDALEKADGPSRELDARIWFTVNTPYVGGTPRTEEVDHGGPTRTSWLSGSAGIWDDELPPYTSSLDAALTLVQAGVRWEIQQDRSAAFASIDGETTGRCVTPAIALCIAALKARMA